MKIAIALAWGTVAATLIAAITSNLVQLPFIDKIKTPLEAVCMMGVFVQNILALAAAVALIVSIF